MLENEVGYHGGTKQSQSWAIMELLTIICHVNTTRSQATDVGKLAARNKVKGTDRMRINKTESGSSRQAIISRRKLQKVQWTNTRNPKKKVNTCETELQRRGENRTNESCSINQYTDAKKWTGMSQIKWQREGKEKNEREPLKWKDRGLL